jgi:rhodanese-related sulfurtransferase
MKIKLPASFRVAAVTIASCWLVTPLSAAEPKTNPQTLTPERAQQMLAKQTNVVVLDVRTPQEFSGGHLKGATNIDARAADFASRLSVLDKSKSYLVHCAHGHERTSKTAELLKGQGFTNVFTLEGGIQAWAKEGKPVVK